MPRTITAGAKVPPKVKDVDCADVVGGLWITLGQMWMKGQRYGDVQRDLRKVSKRLADPHLFDHPLRPGYVVKVEEWRLELRDLDVKADPYRRGVERQWDGLPERIHQFLRESGGWPEGKDGREMAIALWQYAIEGKPFPLGECPF